MIPITTFKRQMKSSTKLKQRQVGIENMKKCAQTKNQPKTFAGSLICLTFNRFFVDFQSENIFVSLFY